ncbi:MAG: hypothetical protein JWO43_315 [Candidatus Adlerbacteria bacterium]|nr:hypothetical protein [Candidatus Adlerbacteria bacterium]
MSRKQLYLIGSITITILIVGLLAWWFLNRNAISEAPNVTGIFGTAGDKSGGTQTNTQTDINGNPVISSNGGSAKAPIIFKISDGPVTGAMFVETKNPTTTLARFVLQENGHVVDLPLDVPGAIVRSVSNTTIPGTQRALWSKDGSGAIFQYLDKSTVKTLYISFPRATASTTNGTSHIQFLPDNIVDIAFSPDTRQVAYLIPITSGGVAGYTASPDGSNAKSLFTIPLAQILISWPATSTIMLQTKSMAGIPGVVFGVSTKNGALLPLIYGQGVTALGNSDLSIVLYQTRVTDSSVVNTYLHNMSVGNDNSVLFNPYPEKCMWNTRTTVFCASPLGYTEADFLDNWHAGVAKIADSIMFFKVQSNIATVIAIPGSNDGGTAADIAQIAISPDSKYLLYVTRGDRSLWGVRLDK